MDDQATFHRWLIKSWFSKFGENSWHKIWCSQIIITAWQRPHKISHINPLPKLFLYESTKEYSANRMNTGQYYKLHENLITFANMNCTNERQCTLRSKPAPYRSLWFSLENILDLLYLIHEIQEGFHILCGDILHEDNGMFTGILSKHFFEVIAARRQDELVGWIQSSGTCQRHIHVCLLQLRNIEVI